MRPFEGQHVAESEYLSTQGVWCRDGKPKRIPCTSKALPTAKGWFTHYLSLHMQICLQEMLLKW